MDKLKPYQKKVLSWMQLREQNQMFGVSGGIVALSMGLGKTLISLAHCVSSDRRLNLVIVPRILIAEWKTQIQKFFPTIPVLYLHKDFLADLNEYIKPKHTLVITSYEMCVKSYKYKDKQLPDIPNAIKMIHAVRWTRVICDEAQRFANPNTVLWNSVMALSATYRWCLSGTPIRNKSSDLWAQLRFCGYCAIMDIKFWNEYGEEMFVAHNLIQFIYVLGYDGANIKLPQKIYHTIRIKLKGVQKTIYLDLLEAVEQKYYEFLNKESSFASILTLFLRLRQSAISPALINETIGQYEDIKLQKIVELVSKPGKFIIFSSFVSALDLIRSMLTYHGIANVQIDGSITHKIRDANLNRFKTDKKMRCLLMTYKVGAEGLNITEASNCIIVEPWWNNAVHEQAISRCWRLGQTKPVNIYFLILANSIEEQIMRICRNKDNIKEAYLHGNFDVPIVRAGLNVQMLANILALESNRSDDDEYIDFEHLNRI